MRTLVIFILWILSSCWAKNFDVNYSDGMAGNTNLGMVLLGKGSRLCVYSGMYGGSSNHSGRRSGMGASLIGALTDFYQIQVSERFTVKTLTDGSTVQYFTIFASQGDKKYPKIERCYRDFKSLEIAMTNNLRSNDIDCPRLERHTTMTDVSDWSDSSDLATSVTEKIQNIKKFCKAIGSDPNLHIEPFYDFFKIPKPDDEFPEDYELERRHSEVEASGSLSRALKQTMKPDAAFGGVEGLFWSHKHQSEYIVDFVTHFKVTLLGQPIQKLDPIRGSSETKKHNYFAFIVKCIIADVGSDRELSTLESSVQVEKRYSEFYDLALQMKDSVKARPPPLPPKIMLKDESNLTKRADALEDWLNLVMNEKMFFCPELYIFLGINPALIPKLSAIDLVQELQNKTKINISVVGNHSVQSSDESYVVWEIQVEILDSGTNDLIDNYRLHRRYKEFDHLHAELRHKFHKLAKDLPQLPSKVSYLNILSSGNKLSQREGKLDTFLKELAKYPNIFQTVAFRKFVDLTTKKITDLLSRTK